MKLSEAVKEQRNRKRYIKKTYLNFVNNNPSLTSPEIIKQFKEKVRILPSTRRLNVTHINVKFSIQNLHKILENATDNQYFVLYNLPPLTITKENINVLNYIKSNEPVCIINKDEVIPLLFSNIDKIERETLFKDFISKILYNNIEKVIKVVTQINRDDISWIYTDILDSIYRYTKNYHKPLPAFTNIKALIERLEPNSCKARLHSLTKILRTEEDVYALYDKISTVSFEDAVEIIIPYPNIILKVAQKTKSIKKLTHIYKTLMNTDILSHPDLNSLLSCILQLNTTIILSKKGDIPTFRKKYIDYIKVIREYITSVNSNSSKYSNNIDNYRKWLKNYIVLRVIKRAYKDGKITDINLLSTSVKAIEDITNHYRKTVESVCERLQTLEELQLLDMLKEELTTIIANHTLPLNTHAPEQTEATKDVILSHPQPRQFIQLSLGI